MGELPPLFVYGNFLQHGDQIIYSDFIMKVVENSSVLPPTTPDATPVELKNVF